MRYRSVLLAGLLGVAVVLGTSACEHADPVGPKEGVQPTLSSLQENVFSPKCAQSGCHAGPNPQQDMNLSAGRAHDNIVNVRSNEKSDLFRVQPGSPDDSYLVHKIEGRSSIVGQQMPLGQDPLSPEEITAIRSWIEDGAPDN